MEQEFRVEFSEACELDVDAIYLYFQRRSIRSATRWYEGFLNECESLTTLPERCPELPHIPGVRRHLYGRYIVLFRIMMPSGGVSSPATVRILHVYH